jgi:hypothetical protein
MLKVEIARQSKFLFQIMEISCTKNRGRPLAARATLYYNNGG